MTDLARTALVVVDVQQAFDDAAYWGPRNNPGCEANIVALVSAWQEADRPVVFVRHDSEEPARRCARTIPATRSSASSSATPDVLVTKHVNSAFHGDPDLAEWLRRRSLDRDRGLRDHHEPLLRDDRARRRPTSASTCCSRSTRRTRSTARGRTARS